MKIVRVVTCMLLVASAMEASAALPFIAAPSFPTGPQPWGTVVEDFNNDGIPDVAMADYDKPAGVYVLLGNGQGSFAFASSPLVGGDAHGLAAADFDGDGNIDMVVSSISNGPSDIVSVLRGHGDGTFDMPVEYSVGAFAAAVRAADINGDGNADIVTANANGNSISVLLGVGDGSFLERVDHNVGDSPMNLFVADVDGDGTMDVAVPLNSIFASFAVLRGTGDGAFSQPTYGGSGQSIFYDMAVADLDNDGRPDMVLIDIGSSIVDIYRALGNGLYANVVQLPGDANMTSVAAGDLYNDGRVEIITGASGGARLFEPDGAGNYRDAGMLPGVSGGASIVIADINGDGMPDIVAPSYESFSSNALLNQTVFRAGFELKQRTVLTGHR